MTVPCAVPSDKGLAHDRMFGGIKSRGKSKKDKLREQQADVSKPILKDCSRNRVVSPELA